MTDLLTELEALAKAWDMDGPAEGIESCLIAHRQKLATDIRTLIAAEKARGPDPLLVEKRDWSKIRDYFDCLGDSEEEKQLRRRWVREMKAENKELRAALDKIDPLLVQAREALVKNAFCAGAEWCREKIVTYLSTPAGGLECLPIAAQDYYAALDAKLGGAK
jgi:hypothetical protein